METEGRGQTTTLARLTGRELADISAYLAGLGSGPRSRSNTPRMTRGGRRSPSAVSRRLRVGNSQSDRPAAAMVDDVAVAPLPLRTTMACSAARNPASSRVSRITRLVSKYTCQ